MTVPSFLQDGLQKVPDSWKVPVRRLAGRSKPWDVDPHIRPPRPSAGQSVGPPDFVGVGAQKAGTSWWFTLLLAHPRIWHSPEIHKERHYFSRFAYDGFDEAAVTDYHRWFPRQKGSLTGEWTPAYMAQFWTPPLLRRAAPQVRILVLLRDPVERFQSALTHYDQRNKRDPMIASDAFTRGLYAEQLAGLFSVFPRAQVLVLQYERCRKEPQEQLARTYDFLGVEPHQPPKGFGRFVNKTQGAKVPFPEGRRELLAERYSHDVRRVATLVPELDVGLWPNFSSLM